MLLSLLICTHKRNDELIRVIRSMAPVPREVEVVIVDQNVESEKVDRKVLEHYFTRKENLRIVQKRLGSLSSARNMGFRECCGEFIGIPDDDNYYDTSFRDRVVDRLKDVRENNKCGGILLNWGAFRGYPLTYRRMQGLECLRFGNSGTIIVRRGSVCKELGMEPFPRDMSPGTPFPAGDETFFLASFLKKSNKILMTSPDIYIDHPVFPVSIDRERAYNYGFGALAVKLIMLGWTPALVYSIKMMLGPVIRLITSIYDKDRWALSWIVLSRRWEGAFMYTIRMAGGE